MRRQDDRSLHEKMIGTAAEWAMILGLSLMAIVWALIAFAAIGSGTRIHPDYNLPEPTPAMQPYNTIHAFQRPRR